MGLPRWAIAVAADGAILVGAELALRVVFPVYADLWSDRDHTFGRAKAGRGYPQEASTLRADPAGQADEVHRIAFFGDSITYGWGLAVDETLPAQVEAALQAGGGAWAAANLAGMGTSPLITAEIIEQELAGWDVDAVVYQFNPSDIGEAPDAHTAEARAAVRARQEALAPLPAWQAWRKLALVGFVTVETDRVNYLLRARHVDLGRWRESVYWQELAPRFDTPEVREGWARQMAALERIDAAARAQDVPLLVILLPYAFDVSERWIDDFWQLDTDRFEVDVFARFAEEADRAGLRHASYRAPARAFREAHPTTPMYFPNHMGHFTAAGIGAVAPSVAADVRAMVEGR